MNYYDTHQLKARGWTATMIARLLPRHDSTRENNLRVGRSRSYVAAPVKRYLVARVEEAETTEEFLIAQAAAVKAREAGRKGLTSRAERTAMVTDAYVAAFPVTLWDAPEEAATWDWHRLWTYYQRQLMLWENDHDGPLWDLVPKARQHARLLVEEKLRALFREAYPEKLRQPEPEDILP